MEPAPNFNIPPGTPAVPYPLPEIEHVTARRTMVPTGIGPREATEVTIRGRWFLIRAVEPEVTVNGQSLVRYVIDDDERTIRGYFFGMLTDPVRVVVDYGLNVRGEWTGPAVGSAAGPAHGRGCLIILLVLLLLALLLLLRP
jgi:hypothetical protein